MKRVLLVGLDGVTLDLVERFVKEGCLPNFQRLMVEGAYGEALPSLPPATSVNWTTIATGSHAGTHGVVGMSYTPVESLFTDTPPVSAFFSHLCRVEKVYEAAEKAGKDVILLKYTTSWPPTIHKGIVVDGFGDPGLNVHDVAPRMCFSTRPMASKPKFARAYPLTLSRTSEQTEHLEAELRFDLSFGGDKTLFLRIDPEAGTASLWEQLDAERPLTTLSQGQWSDWLTIACRVTNETCPAELAPAERRTAPEEKRARFRVKLRELSCDGKAVVLYFTRLIAEDGWTQCATFTAWPTKSSARRFKRCGKTTCSL